jgi:hypothetical protein
MSDLITLLDLSPNSYLLLTNRDQISQQFIFDVLIQDLVKKDNQLLLILLSNNWTNYSTIAAKCGLNLKNLRDKQLIKVIDIISEEQFDYQKFVFKLNEELSHLSSNSVVLIDDLSLFFSLSLNFEVIYKLVHKLRVNCSQNNQILVIGSHFPSEEDDEEVHRLVVSIAHKSDIWCEVNKTRTGFSPLISGSLKIHKRRDNCYKEMNYKLSERSVKLLPLGSHLL